MRVTVLGLGRMGRGIAGRVLSADHDVTVWNRSQGRAGQLVARGATEASSVEAAVDGAEVVITSLTGDKAVAEVLLPNDKPRPEITGTVLDCSTVGPTTLQRLADSYPGRFVASPIAGAPALLERGHAMLLVAGPPDAVRTLAPVLAAISDTTQHAGEDVRQAALTKLINNYLLLGELALLADAVVAGQAMGLSDEYLRDALSHLPVVAPALTNRIEQLLGSRHEPMFTVDLGAKDLRLFAQVAGEAGLQLGLSDAVGSRYARTQDDGHGDEDISAVIEPLRRAASGETAASGGTAAS